MIRLHHKEYSQLRLFRFFAFCCFVLCVLTLLNGCSSPSSDRKPGAFVKPCEFGFSTDNSGSICRWYHNSTFPECTSQMRSEMASRNQRIEPFSECGSPIGSSQSQTSTGPSQCTQSFQTESSASICGWYWGNTKPHCDDQMRKEFTRRGLAINPKESCGRDIRQATPVCSQSFAQSSTSLICSSYWNNTNPQCDSRMREELNKRNLRITPKSECGMPEIQPSSTALPMTQARICARDFRSHTPATICSLYWGNENTECDPQMSAELERRRLKVAPLSECGKPLSLTTGAPPDASPGGVCSVDNVRSFASQPTTKLCQIATSRGPCQQIARTALSGHGLTTGDASLACGRPESKQCEAVLTKVRNSANPVNAACAIRNDKASVEGLRCRAVLAGFLLREGRGSGAAGSTCGSPITTRDLEIISMPAR